MDGFDLIGDIHGHADALRALLAKLGYSTHGSQYGYRHPNRKAIFVGDFIDRGPGQREVINIVRSMTENADAFAVMGNHEFNALAYHTRHPQTGEYLRPHNPNNQMQHQAFLDEYPPESLELAETLDWFYSLPLWLDLEELRIIHASWLGEALDRIRRRLPPERTLTREVLIDAANVHRPEYLDIESLLKGVEVQLPEGLSYLDKGGHIRRRARVKWWLAPEGQTMRSMALIPDPEVHARVPEVPFQADFRIGYGADEPPIFFGHYWLEGLPLPLAANVACLDYSVARPSGKLAAYRWDGETRLKSEKFVWVDRIA